MTLWIAVFAGILLWKGFLIENKKTLAVYAGVGILGMLLMCLYAARILPRFAEMLVGY